MLLKLLSVPVILGAILAFSLYMVGQQHKEAAIQFWGDEYAPQSGANADWGFIGNLVMPEGGPMISPTHAGVCHDTPLPLVPIKVNSQGKGQVLCGIGNDSMVMGFDVNRISDSDLRDHLKDALADIAESGSTTGY